MRFDEIRSILVTGGCGFIGSHFIERIVPKYPNLKIYNLDNMSYASSNFINDLMIGNPNYELIRQDITDPGKVNHLIKSIDIDLIIHFAAESHVDNSITNPSNFVNTNLVGTFNILNALVARYGFNSKVTFHHISTDEVYGSLEANEQSFTEESNYSPNSPYSASKAGSDLLVRAWHRTFKIPYLITNCSNNFGPRQHSEKLIPKIIKHAIQKKEIPIYGDGSNIRDWIYVGDHIDALLGLHENNILNDSYNIGGGVELSNLTITNKIIEILEKRFNFKHLNKLIKFVEDRKGHDFRYSIDASKIYNSIKWKASCDLDQDLKNTIQYYLENNDYLAGKK